MFSIAEIVSSPLLMCAAVVIVGGLTAVIAAMYLRGHSDCELGR